MSMISELVDGLRTEAESMGKYGVDYMATLLTRSADTIVMLSEKARATEAKRGEWIPCTKSGLALTELMRREGQKWYGYRCSNCNHIYKGNALTDCNFCCSCGADMRKESE